MELSDDRKTSLIEEIRKAMSTYYPEDATDITASELSDATGVDYNKALKFLNKLSTKGVLLKLKLPSKAVVYRDIDGKAKERILEFSENNKPETT